MARGRVQGAAAGGAVHATSSWPLGKPLDMTRSRFSRSSRFPRLRSIAGCTSQPSRVVPPSISPQQAAQAAMAEYDTNGDGVLDSAELEKSPPSNRP